MHHHNARRPAHDLGSERHIGGIRGGDLNGSEDDQPAVMQVRVQAGEERFPALIVANRGFPRRCRQGTERPKRQTAPGTLSISASCGSWRRCARRTYQMRSFRAHNLAARQAKVGTWTWGRVGT